MANWGLTRGQIGTSRPTLLLSATRYLRFSKGSINTNSSSSRADFIFSGNLMKPTLDMFIFTAQLSRSLGLFGSSVPILHRISD